MIESLIDSALMITRLIDKEMMIRSLAFLSISVISIISLTFLIDRHLYTAGAPVHLSEVI